MSYRDYIIEKMEADLKKTERRLKILKWFWAISTIVALVGLIGGTWFFHRWWTPLASGAIFGLSIALGGAVNWGTVYEMDDRSRLWKFKNDKSKI